MATNVAFDSVGTNYVSLHAWYSGTTATDSARFYYVSPSWAYCGSVSRTSAYGTNWTTDVFTASGLSPSTQYGFVVEFYSGGSLVATTSTFYTTTSAPSIPTPGTPSPYQSGSTTSSVTVSWSPTSYADYYKVYRDGVLCTTGTNSPYTITGLSPATSYTIWVTAVNSSGSSGIGSCTCTTASAIPSTPSGGVSLSSRGITSLTVAWNPSSYATSYTLGYAQYDGSYTNLGSYTYISTSSTSYTLSGLLPGSAYALVVCANSSSGSSSYSGVNIATTYPDTPSLSTSSVTMNSISVYVGSLSGYVNKINIYRYSSGGGSPLETKTLTPSNIFSGSTVAFTGLASGVTYDFRAVAERTTKDGGSLPGYSSGTLSVATGSIPSTPSAGVSITSRTETSLSLSWGSSTNATGYYLKYAAYASDNVTLGAYTTVGVSGTSYTLTGLTPGCSYELSVAGTNPYTSSSYTGANIGTTSPAIPSLNVISTSGTSITIQASSLTGYANNIYVYLYNSGGTSDIDIRSSTESDGIFSTVTSYTFTGLAVGTTYDFRAESRRITPLSSIVTSGMSPTVSGQTLSVPPTPSSIVVADSRTSTTMSLSWGSAATATSYVLNYWKDSQDGGGSIVEVSPTTNSCNISGLTPGAYYAFQVRAVNAQGSSGYTAVSYATTMPATPVLSSGTVTNSSIIVTCGALSGFATKIYFYKYASGSGTVLETQTITDADRSISSPVSVTFTGLTEGTTYDFRAVAEISTRSNSIITGYTSNTLSVRVISPPAIPTGFQIESRTTTALNLKWIGSTGATSYTIQYWLDTQDGGSGTPISVNTTGTSYTLTGLTPGAYYDLRICATNAEGSSAYTTTSYGTTYPSTPSISNGTVTATSIQIKIDSLSGYATKIYVYRYLHGSTTLFDYLTVTDADRSFSSSTSVNFTGLTAGVIYDFKAAAEITTRGGDILLGNSTGILSIKCGETRPANWAWTSNITSGADFSLTSVEWNGFTARINLFRVYKGLTVATFTTAVKGNIITAAIFNEARTAINAMSPPTAVPATFTSGSAIYASHINGLKNSLNSIL